MAAKRSNKKNSPASKKKEDPITERALQAVILLVGVALIFSVFFGTRWGPAITGALIFATTLQPIRRPVDRWLVGRVRGEAARQAAIIRMAIGVLIVILALVGIFG